MLLKQLLGDKLMLQAYLKNVGKGLDRKMVTQNMAKEESMWSFTCRSEVARKEAIDVILMNNSV